MASVAILLLVSSCREKEQAGDMLPGKSPESVCTNVQTAATANSNALDSVVFCVVDGEDITAEFVRDTVLVAAKIAELGGKKIAKGQFPIWGNNYAMKIVPGLISGKLIEDEARRCGIHATDSSDAKTLEKYNRLTRSENGSKESLAEKFGGLKGAFLRQFDSESLRLAYFSTFPQLDVTDDDIEVYYLNLTNTIRKLSRLDAAAHAKAEAAFKRLTAGEDWDAVARECSEDALASKDNAEYWKEWGLFRVKDLQPPEFASAVASLEVGKFTRPMETDDGLVIAKLISRDEDAFALARILIRLPIRLEVPPRDVAMEKIAAEKNKEFLLELLPRLSSKAKLQYPLGKKFVYRIWDVPKREKKHARPRPKKDLMKNVLDVKDTGNK